MNRELAVKNVRGLLEFFGEDPEREGLKNTPNRVVSFYEEFLDPKEFKWTTFEVESDEMVIVKQIPFYSICEHHLIPFFGKASIAYIPDKKQVGLSKLARCLEYHSRSLQNQERITKLVAESIEKELEPKGVAVMLEAEHFCMAMRGVKVSDTRTVTSKMIGTFRNDRACRNEFLNLIK